MTKKSFNRKHAMRLLSNNNCIFCDEGEYKNYCQICLEECKYV